MTREEFVRLVGGKLVHHTLQENIPSIEMHGLLRPMTLAALAGVDPNTLLLRENDMALRIGNLPAHLNHQKPLRAGHARAAEFLDGHTMESWAAQLDGRTFLFRKGGGVQFIKSLANRGAPASLWLDAGRVFDRMGSHVDLAPFNTGAAGRKPTKRGDWVYVPITANVEIFRLNRVRRGLVAKPDAAEEISFRADVPPHVLADMRAA